MAPKTLAMATSTGATCFCNGSRELEPRDADLPLPATLAGAGSSPASERNIGITLVGLTGGGADPGNMSSCTRRYKSATYLPRKDARDCSLRKS